VLATFLSIKRDLDAIYDKHKTSIMREYNSMQSVIRITDDETLKKIILKPQKFEELQKQLEDMNKVIKKIFDIGQYTQEEPLVVVNPQ
jgi:peptidyl-tRNA hydrolase